LKQTDDVDDNSDEETNNSFYDKIDHTTEEDSIRNSNNSGNSGRKHKKDKNVDEDMDSGLYNFSVNLSTDNKTLEVPYNTRKDNITSRVIGFCAQSWKYKKLQFVNYTLLTCLGLFENQTCIPALQGNATNGSFISGVYFPEDDYMDVDVDNEEVEFYQARLKVDGHTGIYAGVVGERPTIDLICNLNSQ